MPLASRAIITAARQGRITGSSAVSFGFALTGTALEHFIATTATTFGFTPAAAALEHFIGAIAETFDFSILATGVVTPPVITPSGITGTSGSSFSFATSADGNNTAPASSNHGGGKSRGARRPRPRPVQPLVPPDIAGVSGTTFTFGTSVVGRVVRRVVTGASATAFGMDTHAEGAVLLVPDLDAMLAELVALDLV